MKFKIYFLEIDLPGSLYGAYTYLNNVINQFCTKWNIDLIFLFSFLIMPDIYKPW